MGIESDIIREKVDVAYPKKITQIDDSKVNLDLYKGDLVAERDALLWMMSQMTADQIARLEAKGFNTITYEPTFGITEISSFQASWTLDAITEVISVNSVKVDGDQELVYYNGRTVYTRHSYYYPGGMGGEIPPRTVYVNTPQVVDVSTYDAINDWTIIDFVDDATEVHVDSFAIVDVGYTYADAELDDPDIVSNALGFLEAYDHIYKEQNTSGAYGLNARIAGIDLTKAILETEKTKLNNAIAAYDSWGT